MKAYINNALVALGTVAIIISLLLHISSLKKSLHSYKRNQDILLSSMSESYRTKDSLSALRTERLELTLDEYKRYREEDMELIKSLKADRKNLQGIVSASTSTISSLRSALRDSVRTDTVTNLVDTLKCFDYTSKWFDASGCFSKDSTEIRIATRESLILVDHKERKKFLFFKLPGSIFGYKSRSMTVTSKNPSTTITEVEYVGIK